MENTDKLIYKLKETNKFKNKRLANSISKIHNSNTFSITKEGKKMEKNNKNAYKLLLRMFPKDIKEKILGLDKCIEAVADYLNRRTGWVFIGDKIVYRDNFHNMHDPEFRSFDTYEIPRNDSGFYLDDSEGKPLYIRNEEKKFYLKYKSELDALHGFITEKTDLIKEAIFTSSDPELANEIAIYLGLIQDENTQLKTK